ncbi:hypothetical protein OPW41_06280 [Vibrio europaeus]|uniref:hypothetical protein n=1 Tax=Vibrio europaeus TaxID=300876 RepID=UPI00233EF082|nr:hypothetical protein [Vibrio europaeus]MDC5756742.1 hypothetical protein [Vibrio europaeus]MDC5775282.1 hypothetical protein [Vibrio europaeus]MDC5794420.1 hypothetical protein [Vibrio europaeus]MDC5816701.1 hypothetical protein [Vibrio europaeus]
MIKLSNLRVKNLYVKKINIVFFVVYNLAGCGMRDAGCGMRDAGCGMRDGRIVILKNEAVSWGSLAASIEGEKFPTPY